jgi:hypothetical protein
LTTSPIAVKSVRPSGVPTDRDHRRSGPSCWRPPDRGGRNQRPSTKLLPAPRLPVVAGERSAASHGAQHGGQGPRRRLALVPGCRHNLTVVKSHHVSRGWSHSRATGPRMRAVFPGHSGWTTSFATRKSRVQIPSAPLNALVRAISVRPPRLARFGIRTLALWPSWRSYRDLAGPPSG